MGARADLNSVSSSAKSNGQALGKRGVFLEDFKVRFIDVLSALLTIAIVYMALWMQLNTAHVVALIILATCFGMTVAAGYGVQISGTFELFDKLKSNFSAGSRETGDTASDELRL